MNCRYIIKYHSTKAIEHDALRILAELRKADIPLDRFYGRKEMFVVKTGKCNKALFEIQWILEKAYVGGLFDIKEHKERGGGK